VPLIFCHGVLCVVVESNNLRSIITERKDNINFSKLLVSNNLLIYYDIYKLIFEFLIQRVARLVIFPMANIRHKRLEFCWDDGAVAEFHRLFDFVVPRILVRGKG
jgi:hypothetical protein